MTQKWQYHSTKHKNLCLVFLIMKGVLLCVLHSILDNARGVSSQGAWRRRHWKVSRDTLSNNSSGPSRSNIHYSMHVTYHTGHLNVL